MTPSETVKESIESFWKMLSNNQFVQSTNSITDEVTVYPEAIVDMEAVVKINGEFDKYAIDDYLKSSQLSLLLSVKEMVEQKRQYISGDITEDIDGKNGYNQALSDLSFLLTEEIEKINKLKI